MSTAGLNPVQRALVEGTPVDGAGGINFTTKSPAEAALEAETRKAANATRVAKRTSRSKAASKS